MGQGTDMVAPPLPLADVTLAGAGLLALVLVWGLL
jgi:hypothetical protein